MFAARDALACSDIELGEALRNAFGADDTIENSAAFQIVAESLIWWRAIAKAKYKIKSAPRETHQEASRRIVEQRRRR